MLAERLIPILQARFPDRGLRVFMPPERGQLVAVFPAKHPEFGDLEIYDDGDEITIVAGRFTHGHFFAYDEDDPGRREDLIVGEVVEFLEWTFRDCMVFWGSHQTAGGWKPRIEQTDASQHCLDVSPADAIEPGASGVIEPLGQRGSPFVWSGPFVEG